MPDGGKVKIVPSARGKIAQIRELGKKTLNAEDYAQLEELLAHWQQYGFSAYLNYQLGRLMAKMAGADIEVSESPEWEEVWIECDRRWLGEELKDMYRLMGRSPPRLGKKDMCMELYRWGQPQIVELVDSFPAPEGDPLSKFCCRECGECAPNELLEEGKFPERMDWLRKHYAAKHPEMGGKHVMAQAGE